jgi:hypothetical protein
MASAPRSRVAREPLPGLEPLPAGWNGDGWNEVTSLTVETARSFADELGVAPGPASPTKEGAILFEWDLPEDVSVYCSAEGRRVEVVIFDGEKAYAELWLPPVEAAAMASAVVRGRS